MFKFPFKKGLNDEFLGENVSLMLRFVKSLKFWTCILLSKGVEDLTSTV